MLITEGCDINSSNNLGWSPLHFAVRYGRLNIAKALVSKGAVAYFPDKIGRSPQVMKLFSSFGWFRKSHDDGL